MASLTNNDVDRTEWADFSVPSNSMKLNHIVDKPEQSDILTPPILTLPLEHYKMISNRFFFFLQCIFFDTDTVCSGFPR